MNDDLRIESVFKVFFDVFYEIPIYQRNYTWEELQIEQLIEDIETAEDNYFLGNIIVNQKDNNIYEVIDGQQRLTTIFLLERYLKIDFSKEALKFEARERANRTLAVVGLDDVNYIEEMHSIEILRGYKIIENYFSKNRIDKKKFIKKLSAVKLIRVQVPKKTDLNHYFEIMNTRGEQLEMHEIAKAKILGALDTSGDKKVASEIWEYCSKMDSYVQMNFKDISIRNNVFDSKWNDLSNEVYDFDTLKKCFNKKPDSEKRTLLEILITDSKIDMGDELYDFENERFESTISFTNFLLQINAAIMKMDEDETNLDDRNLLKNLKSHWENEENAKKFIFVLLKSRILFDKFILKREYARDYKETGKWSLQRLEKYSDRRSDKPQYLSTLHSSQNKKILGLQSALRITYTSPKTMHWISLLLSELLGNQNINILDVLENYSYKKAMDSIRCAKNGLDMERITFTYLDYLLYKNGYYYKGKQLIKPLSDDWQFQFRSSIEHFYPQHPTERKVWNDIDLNSFGNLALITVSGNSTFNNAMPIGKINTNPGIIKQSLKLMIMADMMKMNGNEWTEKISLEHQIEMFEILQYSTSKH